MNDYLQWFVDTARDTGPEGMVTRLAEHVVLSGVSVLVACLIALPIGVGLGHFGRGGALAVTITNASRAIPTFAVLVLAVVVLGFGFTPNVVALSLFAIPPVLLNTFVGMRGVDDDVKEAARGMGMSGAQLLRRVEVPLALPLIAAGIRTATVQVIATATLAAYVDSGGLGRYVRDGYAVGDDPQIVGGAVLVAALALLAEIVLAIVQRRLTPGRQRVLPGAAAGGQVPYQAEERAKAVAAG